MSSSFSCVLIGGSSLLVSCAQQIMDDGQKIEAIISSDNNVIEWAAKHQIVIIKDDLNVYPERLKAFVFDYLFSVVNLVLIPGNVLDLASKLSVNYHDSALPSYAGIHATSWALFNQEKSHGVTWHEIVAEPDKGKVLSQTEFAIEDGETAFSLNLKCYEAAVESFAELIRILAENKAVFIDQDFTRRTYFSKYKRPDNLALIDWSQPAKKIESIVNSLNFSGYDNPLAKAKLRLGDQFYCVNKVAISSRVSTQPAGVIQFLKHGEVSVATATEDLLLDDVSHLNGMKACFAKYSDLGNMSLESDFYVSEDQSSEYMESVRSENFWVSEFMQVDQDKSLAKVGVKPPHKILEWDIPLPVGKGLDACGDEYIVAIFCAFVGRIRKSEAYTIGVESKVALLSNYYLSKVPLSFSINATTTFQALLDEVGTKLRVFETKGPCPVDIFSRYVALSPSCLQGHEYKFEISFEIDHTATADECLPPAVASHGLIVRFQKIRKKWVIFSGEEVDVDFFACFEGKLNDFCSALLNDESVMNALVSKVDLVGADDRSIIENINATSAKYAEKSACEIFYEWADKKPLSVAVVSNGCSYSYEQLRKRVEVLASHLVSRGVGKNDRVGVLLDRSFDLVASLLAVMRANAIYVPLDPIYPVDRLQHMIDDSGLSALISQCSIRSNLRCENLVNILVDGTSIASDPVERLFPKLDDSVYVIYTSGSTGKPKGVEITHRGLTNFLLSMAAKPGFKSSDYLLSVTTVCFDIAALEIFLPLISGGTVEICSDKDSKDGFSLLERIEKGHITFLQATPTTWEMLIAAGWDTRLSVKALCGGEPLRKELASQLVLLCDELWNMYGPTETTIWSSIKQIKNTELITVGRPIANTSMYVLDEYLNPVSSGEKGELYIGGDGVARGYWCQEGLSSEKFIKNPLSLTDGDRLYRSGDAACYTKSGEIICLGRIDNQVKLNGYRIELGEIEATIESIAGIEKAVVVIQAQNQQCYLHGFILCDDKAELMQSNKICEYLSDVLPAYMVPRCFQSVTEFPLTLNGKVDRNALADSVESVFLSCSEQDKTSCQGELATESYAKNKLFQLINKDINTFVKEIVGLNEVDVSLPFGQYGFNSLRFTQLSSVLRKHLSIKVSPATFYTHTTIDKVCHFLLGPKYISQMADVYKVNLTDSSPSINHLEDSQVLCESFEVETTSVSTREPVAIVGLSVKMPQAEDANAFWRNLQSGLDGITEIPMSRWDWRSTEFGSGNENPFKWGGFIPDVACFDAAFFKISPREAELMDPQQRLFLQASYHAIEDAGYSLAEIDGSNTGVYVGVVTSDYWDLVQQGGVSPDGYTISGNINCVIANRVSYQFNLRGPSAVIDTACSSSLVAMHRAVRAIQSGDCSAAIVGGVNVIASPYIHHSFSKNGMLSKDGHCMSFDERANGYVRSEGVSAIILKPLSRAEADGDHIYAVVLGSSENHGGRSNSLSAPSGEAQTSLIEKAMHDAGIDSSSIDYIEAHGSGTPLGDPIEVEGIQQAFARLRTSVPTLGKRCGIGSVKSNIGHLEAAAGLAGVAKVLLALQHQELPGMPLFKNQNPQIDLDESRFYFVKDSQPWPKSEVGTFGDLRRAGVSSFGFGGVNAHVVLEEYSDCRRRSESFSDTNLLLLSARDKEDLNLLVAHYLEKYCDGSAFNWNSICYTSQVGRTHFDERLMVEASSVKESCERLREYLTASGSLENVVQANIHDMTEGYEGIFKGVAIDDLLESLLEKKAITSLGRFWLSGSAIDWTLLYSGVPPLRASLPLYPFKKTTFWLPNHDLANFTDLAESGILGKSHPLVDEWEDGSRIFRKKLDINNPLFGDHVVDQQVIFPAVGYLEFARAAGDLVAGKSGAGYVIAMKGNVWFQALVVDHQPRILEVELQGDGKKLEYTIRSSTPNRDDQLHATGFIYVAAENALPQPLNLKAIRDRCDCTLTNDFIYEMFGDLKFQYKAGYKPIQNIVSGTGEALAEIILPNKFSGEYDLFKLHPSLLEGGIQSVIGVLAAQDQDSTSPYLPFSMKSLNIYSALSKRCFVHVRLVSDMASAHRGIRTFNIDIVDPSGNLLVEIRDYSLKTLVPKIAADRGRAQGAERSENVNPVHFFEKSWINTTREPTVNTMRDVLIFSPTAEMLNNIGKGFNSSCDIIGVLPGEEFSVAEGNIFTVNPRDEVHFKKLLEHLTTLQRSPRNVVYAWGYAQESEYPEGLLQVMAQSILPFFSLCTLLSKSKLGQHTRLLYLYSLKSKFLPVHSGVAGLIRSLHQENRKIRASLIGLDQSLEKSANYILSEIFSEEASIEIRYAGGLRQTPEYYYTEEIDCGANDTPYLLGGVYLVSGGAGGIGRKIVRRIAESSSAKIAVVGRRALSDEIKAEWSGVDYHYYQGDITSLDICATLVGRISQELGEIKGVLHCAGGLSDKLIANKPVGDIPLVVDPKVMGLYALDYVTRNLDLDFFCSFSSISSVMGNIGQTDYSYANAVLDGFNEHRRALVNSDLRKGKTISVNWPLWLDGGMSVSDASIQYFKESTGVEPLMSEQALDILDYVLTNLDGPIIFSSGDNSKILSALKKRSGILSSGQLFLSENKKKPQSLEINSNDLLELLQTDLVHMAASILKMEARQVTPDILLTEIGFDSISNTEFANCINARFGTDITPIVFFEYGTLLEVASHLASEYGQLLSHSVYTDLSVGSDTAPSSSINGVFPLKENDSIAIQSDELMDRVLVRLTQMAASILKADAGSIKPHSSMPDMGFDSISNTEFTNLINSQFGTDVTPIVFFEYSDLAGIAAYLIAEYEQQLHGVLCDAKRENDTDCQLNTEHSASDHESKEGSFQIKEQGENEYRREDADTSNGAGSNRNNIEDIAIIGMKAMLPGGGDLDQFWTDLFDGRDFVREVPSDRWSWQDYFGEADEGELKTSAKWGAFLNDIDKFDAEFFNISAEEAKLLDPQQRLFIQLVWHAIEDAGYSISELGGTNTGLYVGLSNRDYSDYLQRQGVPLSPESSFGNNNAFLVNRISYLFDFNGPSEAVDTLCSSSLVALHRALQDLRSGCCDRAIVGGISIIMSPNLSSVFEQAQMLSKDGLCKTFDERADGFVRGEGGAALMLKPLKQAQQDGDNVIGIIKGCGVNHGGRANSLTAPNLKAQHQLIKQTYRMSGIHPATVSYIEAHGTGTKLGDPIEIKALSKAFSEWDKEPVDVIDANCAIGSVKTNIGHLESASGIASIVKVLLSFKHKQLPKLAHFEKQNPYINLKGSPFYLLADSQEWKALTDRSGRPIPRRAAINAFGAGGVNAHVILEEYENNHPKEFQSSKKPRLIILSAKSKERLDDYAKLLSEHLLRNSESLQNVAYTLQVGRDAFQCRLAIVCEDVAQLPKQLKKFIDGVRDDSVAYSEVGTSILVNSDSDGELGKIKENWLVGNDVDWELFNHEDHPRRIPLPGYPFDRKRHWVEVKLPPPVRESQGIRTPDVSRKPLMISADFHQGQAYLAGHKVFDDEVLLGVTYPSMALESVRSSTQLSSANRLKNILFYNPLILHPGDKARVLVGFSAEDEALKFETYFQIRGNSKTVMATTGEVSINERKTEKIELNHLMSLVENTYDQVEIYDLLRQQGVDYSGSLQTIKTVLTGKDMAIARVYVSPQLVGDTSSYFLHPAWLDAAIVTAKFAFTRDSDILYIPFSIQDVVIHRKPENLSYCVLTKVTMNNQILKCDLQVCNHLGEVAIESVGICCKKIASKHSWGKSKLSSIS